MIPADIRLYTWVDVNEVFKTIQKEGNWPEWLVWVEAYWDGLNLEIKTGSQDQALIWLADTFDPRFDKQSTSIILESVQKDEIRLLPILFDETDQDAVESKFVPTLANPNRISRNNPIVDSFSNLNRSNYPPIICFHSFKGGVGRTTLALAFSQTITLGDQNKKVLLIDADMEAPGISWLIRSRLPSPEISFADFLALVHGDPDKNHKSSINLVANRLQSMQLDNVFVLPAFRSLSQFRSFEIRPEFLIRGSSDPFILTHILSELGKQLNVSAVIVDLRAGLSELSAGLLLDPQIYRVLVTTLSAQSFEGTIEILDILSSMTPKGMETIIPSIITSQVPDTWRNNLKESEEKLIQALSNFWEDDGEGEEKTHDFVNLVIPHNPNLMVLSGDWEKVINTIGLSKLPNQLSDLAEILPLSNTASQTSIKLTQPERTTRRRDLAEYTEKLIFAEKGQVENFLTINPLRRLANDFKSKIPISIVIGAKGSGKTYTFLQIIRRGIWQKFVKDALSIDTSDTYYTCPVTWAKNLSDDVKKTVIQARSTIANELGFDQSFENLEIIDYIRDGLQDNLHEGQWRDRWINIIAWSLGFPKNDGDSGKKLLEHLRQKQKSVIAVFDGLEDLFQYIPSDIQQQTALRSLLQDVPDWLEQQPFHPLGLLVFIRSDMVAQAVRQNSAQLISRYEPYVLRWGEEEALKLVLWTASQAKAMNYDKDDILSLSQDRLVEELAPLWGRKLGITSSKEARTAEFVIAALSDFKGQIQARDLIRLLNQAAKDSLDDNRWEDRLLIPTAIRSSVRFCGTNKVNEIGQEYPDILKIFNQLMKLPPEAKHIPFTLQSVGLNLDQVQILEENGIVLRDKEEYYMPEVFRLGLDFTLTKRGRPKVFALSRQARRRLSN